MNQPMYGNGPHQPQHPGGPGHHGGPGGPGGPNHPGGPQPGPHPYNGRPPQPHQPGPHSGPQHHGPQGGPQGGPSPYGVHPQAPIPPGAGRLVLHAKRAGGAMGMGVSGRAVINNQHQLWLDWNRPTHVDLPAGQHRIDANCRYMWAYGQANTTITVQPGTTTNLWYATPWLTFQKGVIGTEPQKIPGLTGLIIYLAAAVLIIAAIIGGTVLLALNS